MKLKGIKIFNEEWEWKITKNEKSSHLIIKTNDIIKIAFVSWWIVYRRGLRSKYLDKKREIRIFGEKFSLNRTLSFNHVFYKDYIFSFFIPNSAIHITPMLIQVDIMADRDFPYPARTNSIELSIRRK